MLVQVFKVDGEEIVTTFEEGSHALGRGPTLQCNDKRVSRNHATIEVTRADVKLISNHINPCFLRAANSKTITILAKDCTQKLNDGDSFALLPDDFWFKIKLIENESSTEAKTETTEKTSKRNLEATDEEPPDKKQKIKNESDFLDEDDSVQNENEETESHSIILKEEKSENEATGSNEMELEEENEIRNCIKEENLQQENSIEEQENSTKEENQQENSIEEEENLQQETSIKEEENSVPSTNDVPTNDNTDPSQDDASSANKADDGNPSGSNVKLRRERCWYGAQCYRKNPLHRQDFTHPGDSDYDSDPDDNRPVCGFGANCYRKNKLHRQQYKHPPRQPQSKKKRTRKKVDRLNVADSEEMRALDDSEDPDDPFIADDDSDDYDYSGSDDDSDWDDSQGVDEDGKNLKRLVKEANRFTKN